MGQDSTHVPNSLLRYHKLYGMLGYNAAVDDTIRPYYILDSIGRCRVDNNKPAWNIGCMLPSSVRVGAKITDRQTDIMTEQLKSSSRLRLQD